MEIVWNAFERTPEFYAKIENDARLAATTMVESLTKDELIEYIRNLCVLNGMQRYQLTEMALLTKPLCVGPQGYFKTDVTKLT